MKRDLFGEPFSSKPRMAGIGRGDQLTFRGNLERGRHGWLRLTPAYSVHVVETILQDARPDDRVLDPFSGTGTTPLTASMLGIPSQAVDINPFLGWLGNLKVGRFSDEIPVRLIEVANDITDTLQTRPDDWAPEIHAIEKWWDPRVLAQLAALFREICSRVPADSIGDLMCVAFCRTLIQSANVSFGHQSMSFRRAASKALPLFDDDAAERVNASFLSAVADVATGLVEKQPMCDAEIFVGDSRELTKVLPRRDYSLVVTSPPYPNRMSYIRELRPYMYWLGYLTNGRQAGELDWRAIGGTWGCATSLLATWEPTTATLLPNSDFERLVSSIRADHLLLGRYVHRYFEDVRRHLVGLRDVLAPGARCYYIVGNSKFYGTLLPVEELYAALFRDLGFTSVEVGTIRKRSSKKELFEFVVHARWRT